MERPPIAHPRGVADDLLALDLVHEDHRGAVAAEGPEEDGLPGALHQRPQRGPRDLRPRAVGGRAHSLLERLRAEPVLAELPLLEIAPGGQGAQQREQAALRRLELRAQLAQGQPLAGADNEFEDVHHAPGRAMGAGGRAVTLADRAGGHARPAGTSKPKKRAALSPSTLARAVSDR